MFQSFQKPKVTLAKIWKDSENPWQLEENWLIVDLVSCRGRYRQVVVLGATS